MISEKFCSYVTPHSTGEEYENSTTYKAYGILYNVAKFLERVYVSMVVMILHELIVIEELYCNEGVSLICIAHHHHVKHYYYGLSL